MSDIKTNNCQPECKRDTVIIHDEWDEYDEEIFTIVYFSGCDVKPKGKKED